MIVNSWQIRDEVAGNLRDKRVVNFVLNVRIHKVEIDIPAAILAGHRCEEVKLLVKFVTLGVITRDDVPILFGKHVSDVIASGRTVCNFFFEELL